jgi:hypothetical protein
MDTRLTMLLSCLTAFALGGCTGHTHSLVQDQGDRDITMGTFRHEGADGTSMVLVYRGTHFEARDFAIARNQNLVELKRLYSSGKHYDQIFSGLDTDHYLYSAQPVLSADNGTSLRCMVAWRAGDSPAGHCVTADGSRINFRSLSEIQSNSPVKRE